MTSAANDLIQVEGEDRTYGFRGRLLAHVTTETDASPRWTEIELYELTDGTGRYVVHIVGRSVLYHHHDSPCNAGVPTKMLDLVEDAEPCPRCQPPRYRDCDQDDLVVDAESDRHTITVCAGVTEVLDALRLPNRRGYSAPAQRLLDEVRHSHPEFAAQASSVEWL